MFAVMQRWLSRLLFLFFFPNNFFMKGEKKLEVNWSPSYFLRWFRKAEFQAAEDSEWPFIVTISDYGEKLQRMQNDLSMVSLPENCLVGWTALEEVFLVCVRCVAQICKEKRANIFSNILFSENWVMFSLESFHWLIILQCMSLHCWCALLIGFSWSKISH